MSVATVMRHTSSAQAAIPLRTPAGKPEPRRATPLRLVPKRRSSAARTPFVVVVVALLITGLLGLLLLNMLVAQGSFALHALNKQGKALDQREQELSNRAQALQAPAVLARRASDLGMVPGGPPAFLQLPSGRVLGEPTAGLPPLPVAAATATTAARPTKTARPTQPTAGKPRTGKPTASKPKPAPASGAGTTTP